LFGMAVVAGLLPLVNRRLVAWRWRPRQGPLLAVSLGALTLGGLVAISHDAKATATAAAIHRDPLFGAAARVLDEQSAGTRGPIRRATEPGDRPPGPRRRPPPPSRPRDGHLRARAIGHNPR